MTRETKVEQEKEMLELLRGRVDLVVLARAVRWHLEGRVLVHENKTVVFH